MTYFGGFSNLLANNLPFVVFIFLDRIQQSLTLEEFVSQAPSISLPGHIPRPLRTPRSACPERGGRQTRFKRLLDMFTTNLVPMFLDRAFSPRRKSLQPVSPDLAPSPDD